MPEVVRLCREGGVTAHAGGGSPPEADRPACRAADVAAVYTPKDFDLNKIMGEIVDLAGGGGGGGGGRWALATADGGPLRRCDDRRVPLQGPRDGVLCCLAIARLSASAAPVPESLAVESADGGVALADGDRVERAALLSVVLDDTRRAGVVGRSGE